MSSTRHVTVTTVEPHEWRLVKDLRLRALAESPHSFGSSLQQEVAYGEDDWKALMARGRWFHATAGGASIGMTAVLTNELRRGGNAHMISFWVDPANRGSGTASALLDAAREAARAIGAAKLVLWVADESRAARRFYTRMGFLATGHRQPLPSDPSIEEELLELEL